MPSDPEQFSLIFNETYPGLCRFLQCLLGDSYSAQDIAQESLMRLFNHGIDKIPAPQIRFWLFRVARNLAHNELSKRKTHFRILSELKDFFIRSFANPETELVKSEEQQQLIELLKTLSEDQRTAILLREQEELSYQEIALIMGVSESKVKVDIFRARNQLKEKWHQQLKLYAGVDKQSEVSSR